MLAWQLLTKFQDAPGMASEHLSRDVRIFDPGWGGETFGRPIEGIQFFLPTGHRIVMTGMAQYNFFLECSAGIGGASRIDAVCVCGLIPWTNQVDIWRVAQGRVVRQRESFGREWCGGPTSGWKPGVPGQVFSQITVQ